MVRTDVRGRGVDLLGIDLNDSLHQETFAASLSDYFGVQSEILLDGVCAAPEVQRLRDDLTVFCRKSRLPVVFTELTDVVVTTNDQCDFTRSRAYDAVRSYVRQLDSRQCLHAIFCTNDERALCAVDALSLSSSATQGTVVVGVDGVVETKALIDTANSPLRATVVQDTHRLAVSVVGHLNKMHRGRTVPKRTFLHAEIYEAS